MKKTSVVKYSEEGGEFEIEQVPDVDLFEITGRGGDILSATLGELIALHKFIGEVLFDIDPDINLVVPVKPTEVVQKAPMLSKFAPGDH